MSEPRPPDPEARLSRIGLPNPLSRVAAAAIALFVLAAIADIESASAWLGAARDAVVDRFDALFVGVATLLLVTVAGIVLHPRAGTRLGPDDARPEFGRLSWFAMLFSAGLASGVLYWGTAEPVLHFQDSPFLPAATGEAAAASEDAAVRSALRVTLLHWGLHGWAMYVLAGLAIGVYGHRRGGTLSFRTALTPILGERGVEGWPGRAVDLLALFGTVCGVATSIGLSAASMNATLGGLTGIEVGLGNQIAIVLGVCALGIASALSGLSRGIRRLSELNLWVSLALLAAFVVLGPSVDLAALLGRSLVDYGRNVVPDGLWVASSADGRAWQASWTVFYWGWWLAWTPFVSLFIARISRGRTIREFAIAVTLVPTLVTVVWMTVFGGTALHQELAQPGVISGPVNEDYSLGIVAVIGQLATPAVATALTAVASFLLFTWLITSLDSATLVITHLLGAHDRPAAKVLWGAALAAVTTVLLLFGGVPALQAASIVIGLPLAVMMVALTGGLVHDLLRGRF